MNTSHYLRSVHSHVQIFHLKPRVETCNWQVETGKFPLDSDLPKILRCPRQREKEKLNSHPETYHLGPALAESQCDS